MALILFRKFHARTGRVSVVLALITRAGETAGFALLSPAIAGST